MSTLQNTKLVLTHVKGVIPDLARSVAGTDPLVALARHLEALALGMGTGKVGDCEVVMHRGTTDAAAARANGTVALSSGTGTITITIGGVAFAETWATSDVVTMTALVAAIMASANALIAGVVQAGNLACTIALSSVAAGQWVDIDGVRFTARQGPASDDTGDFEMGGSDTADGAALTAKINAHPKLKNLVFASNSAGTVTVRQLTGTTGLHVFKEGAGITLAGLSSGNMAAVDTCIISALEKSVMGNHITLAASGTGATASGARLTGGVGGNSATPKVFSF